MDVLNCMSCRLCEGSHYLWPPILFAGRHDASILVVGQNPGVFPPTDDKRVALGEYLATVESTWPTTMVSPDRISERVVSIYNEDFGESYGCQQLSKVFGDGWLDSGQFCYTNAVRCRTVANMHPTEEMQVNCRNWTLKLLEQPRDIVVTIGAVAKNQVLGPRSSQLFFGEHKRLSNGTVVFAIKHWSAWYRERDGGRKLVVSYSETFAKLVGAIDDV